MSFETLVENAGCTEGPVFRSCGDILYTTLDRGAVYTFDGSEAMLLAVPGGVVNGATEGPDGSTYLAMAGGHFPGRAYAGGTGGIGRIGPEGTFSWVTTDPVAPNDLCFGPEGLLYCTDPTRNRKHTDGRLWRVDVSTGEPEHLLSVDWYPNGIGFGLDEALYVADTYNQLMVRYQVTADGLDELETVIRFEAGVPDGFAFDADGNIVIPLFDIPGDQSHLQVWTTDGRLLENIEVESGWHLNNVALASDGRMILTDGGRTADIMAGRNSGGALRSIRQWPVAGLPLHPFR